MGFREKKKMNGEGLMERKKVLIEKRRAAEVG